MHRFGGAGPLILGGVRIPHEMGLVAHSDGDVLVHAVCDALLGALALGDIGQLFPDTDPAFSGADSRGLLRTVMQLVWKRGFVVGNLDVTVAAQKPRLAPHEAQMRANLAGDMHVEVDRVSIKATTTEGERLFAGSMRR